MKKASLLIAFVALGIIGCDKTLEDFGKFSVPIEYTQSVDINGVPGGITQLPAGGQSADLPTIGVATNSEESINTNNTSKDKISSFKLSTLSLSLTAPANANFDFMDTVRLYLSTKGGQQTLAAYKYGIAKGQKTIQLDCDTTIDFKNHFFADSLYVRMGAHFVGIPDTGTKMDIKPKFILSGNLLK